MGRRDDELSLALGALLRELRRARGLTQEALAERIGVEVGNYAHVEQGVANPTLSTLGRFAEALDVPVHELLRPPRTLTVARGRPRKAKASEAKPKRTRTR
jgi:UDP-N-acetylglucosamine 1-carboxyvinyltransferase